MAPGHLRKTLHEGCYAQQVTVIHTAPGPLAGDMVYTLRHTDGRTSRWLRPRDQQNIPNIPEPAGTRIARLG